MKDNWIPVGQLLFTDPLKEYLSSFIEGQGQLSVHFEEKSPAKSPLNRGRYFLLIQKEGIHISGNRTNALAKLVSLIRRENGQSYLPEISLEEKPLYPWRGVLLDEARHYFGKTEVQRILDEMFLLRYNVFHWHLSDDQGFRLALQRYPDLADASVRLDTREGWIRGKQTLVPGPYGFAYTEQDIAEICSYAADRGIEIVPEIDLPGHLSAILSCHPEFSCGKTPFAIPDHFGIFPTTLCLGNAEARKYLVGLIDEIAALFQAKHLHLGFDEIKGASMKKCPACQQKIQTDHLRNEKQLIRSFQKELTRHLKEKGITPLFWNDGMDEKELNAIEEVWTLTKPGSKRKTLRQINGGQKAIIAPFFSTYASNAYAIMPLRRTFAFEPVLKGVTHPENILGSEICYWSEYGTSAQKLYFEFDVRAAILSATLWGKKEGTYAHFIRNLPSEYPFLFLGEKTIDEKLMNPRGFARLHQLRAYFDDTESEFRRSPLCHPS